MEYNKMIKDKFSSYFNFFKNKFHPKESNSPLKEHDNVKLVERKRKIFYFSKFTLDVNEILFIYQTIRSIKENVLKHMIDSIKYCAKGIYLFYFLDILRFLSNEDDNEKVVIIFTICFLRVYINYREDYTFEEYFSQDLINSFTKYGVFICNLHQFKVFSYAFFPQTMKEMKLLNYSELKKLNLYYDKTILEDQNILMEEVKSSHPDEKNKNFIYKFAHYTQNKLNISNIKYNIRSMMTKQVMTPLISATERVVDMILSVKLNVELDERCL